MLVEGELVAGKANATEVEIGLLAGAAASAATAAPGVDAAAATGVAAEEVESRSKKLNSLAKNPSPLDEVVAVEGVEEVAELDPELKKPKILSNILSNELVVVEAAATGAADATGWTGEEATGIEPATAVASTTSVWYTVTIGAA